MKDPVGYGARRAAERLAGDFDPRIVFDVEQALHGVHASPTPEQYFDPVSLASLIVSVASLTWNVYQGSKERTPEPTPEDVARDVRVDVRVPSELTPAQGERVISVVVEETLKASSQT